MSENFISSVLNGSANITDIEDFVDDLHNGDSDLTLHEYLGLKKLEYDLWFIDTNTLEPIIEFWKNHVRAIMVTDLLEALVEQSK